MRRMAPLAVVEHFEVFQYCRLLRQTACRPSSATRAVAWPACPLPLLLLLAITAMTVFLSELTSNTAQVATMVPVLAAMSPVLGLDPRLLILACTLGASSAYMMPVGTPLNAIVLGTGLVRLPQMMKAGVWLNLAGILVITALVTLFSATFLGHIFGPQP